jgi:uncharacterized tellurite resistance protein B-like protein
MNFKSTIIQLYFMLIYSDGQINQGEIALGKKMIQAEGISESEFDRQIASLNGVGIDAIYKTCLNNLKRLTKEQQIRCIAWLCVLANSDGFMDKKEWQFIYKVYHKELQLPLDNIMTVQKELNVLTRDSLFVMPKPATTPSSRIANA